MSVMCVSFAHVNTLTSWAAIVAPDTCVSHGGRTYRMGNRYAEAAAVLHAANLAAYVARYGQDAAGESPQAFRPQLITAAANLSLGQLYELLQCLESNSDGWDGWDGSEAQAVCASLKRALCQLIPGRKGARWTVESAADVASMARGAGFDASAKPAR
jgi:hypothetical protein